MHLFNLILEYNKLSNIQRIHSLTFPSLSLSGIRRLLTSCDMRKRRPTQLLIERRNNFEKRKKLSIFRLVTHGGELLQQILFTSLHLSERCDARKREFIINGTITLYTISRLCRTNKAIKKFKRKYLKNALHCTALLCEASD